MRGLTVREREVLAHVVVNPDHWWEHANNYPTVNAEEALALKVSRWGPEHDQHKEGYGAKYKTRAEKETPADLAMHEERHTLAQQACVDAHAKIAGTFVPPLPELPDETIHVLTAGERATFEKAMPADQVDRYAADKWRRNAFAGTLAEFEKL